MIPYGFDGALYLFLQVIQDREICSNWLLKTDRPTYDATARLVPGVHISPDSTNPHSLQLPHNREHASKIEDIKSFKRTVPQISDPGSL